MRDRSPWHCVAEVSRRLRGAGFVELDERVSWSTAVKPGGKNDPRVRALGVEIVR